MSQFQKKKYILSTQFSGIYCISLSKPNSDRILIKSETKNLF